jgi:hypothetical protein
MQHDSTIPSSQKWPRWQAVRGDSLRLYGQRKCPDPARAATQKDVDVGWVICRCVTKGMEDCLQAIAHHGSVRGYGECIWRLSLVERDVMGQSVEVISGRGSPGLEAAWAS